MADLREVLNIEGVDSEKDFNFGESIIAASTPAKGDSHEVQQYIKILGVIGYGSSGLKEC